MTLTMLPRNTLGRPRPVESTAIALIRTALRKQTGVAAGLDPRHVMAWILVGRQVDLMAMSVEELQEEVATAISCAISSTALENERLALSLDL